jgi:hypothetical protein
MRVTRLQEIEEMAAKLLETDRKFPPGPERSNILQEIGRVRSQIVSLQGIAYRSGRGLRAEGK